MGYSIQNLRQVDALLQQRRETARQNAESRTRRLHAMSQEIADIDAALSQTAFAVFRIACGNTDRAVVEKEIAAVRKENEALQQKRAECLVALGLGVDYTDIRYTCPLCHDQGYTDKGTCSCKKQLLLEAGFRSSGLGVLLDRQSFDTFSLQYYDKENRPNAERILDTARRFAEDFDQTHANLLFIGGTGLGKTHLSTAIARRAIERGMDVVYESAPNILADFEHDKFKSGYSDTPARADKYFECDLLIMDDLGAEMSTQFSVSTFYHLINTRINRGGSMIISTNLGQKGLMERYDERITSRLLGEFYPFLFRGTDIRRLKK